jgi:tetratricopeptide (TPR) repeat protein
LTSLPNCGFRIADCGLLISSLLNLFGAHFEINKEEKRLKARNPHSAIRNFSFVLFIMISIPAIATDFTKDLQKIDNQLKKGKFKEVLSLSDSVIQRAEKEDNWNAKGRALIYSAQASHSLGHAKEMKSFIEQAISIFKRHNDPSGLGRGYYVYSFYYLKNNDAEEMYRLLEIGRGYAEKGSDMEVRIRILLGLGLANWNLGRFSEAIKQLNDGAELARKNDQTHLLALAHENLAMNYSARADFRRRLKIIARRSRFSKRKKIRMRWLTFMETWE